MNETEPRFVCTNWDKPVVFAKKRSGKRPDLELKVKSNGTRTIRNAKVVNEILSKVRMGFDVVLAGDNGPAVRFYSCMQTDCKTMYVCAQSMGTFRHSLGDKKAEIFHCGKKVDGEKLAAEARAANAEYKANHIEVTPDTIVQCPSCGTEIRVGKSMNK